MKTDSWKHIGIVARSLAARLVAAREEIQKAADAPSTQRAAEVAVPLPAEEGGPTTGEKCRRPRAAACVGAHGWEERSTIGIGKVDVCGPPLRVDLGGGVRHWACGAQGAPLFSFGVVR